MPSEEPPADHGSAASQVPSGLAAALTQPRAGTLLRVALTARFGRAGDRVDLSAAAALDVSPRTVRRWLQDRPDRSNVPAGRVAQLMAVLAPTPGTRRREDLELEQAEQGLSRVRMGARRGDHAQWANTGWLQPHTVAVLDLDNGLRRVAVTRNEKATTTRITRRTPVVDQVTVSTKFAATILRHALLRHVDAWRVEADPQTFGKGYTQVWLKQAQLPALDLLAGRRFRVHPRDD